MWAGGILTVLQWVKLLVYVKPTKMKKKNKIQLEDLRVESFVTSLNEKEMQTVQGGTGTDEVIRSIIKSIVIISKKTIEQYTKPENWCTVNITCESKPPSC